MLSSRCGGSQSLRIIVQSDIWIDFLEITNQASKFCFREDGDAKLDVRLLASRVFVQNEEGAELASSYDVGWPVRNFSYAVDIYRAAVEKEINKLQCGSYN